MADNDKEEKIETSAVHFRTSPDNLDALKGNDYRTKREAKKNDDYLNPHQLTMQKLLFASAFPQDIDISVFSELVRTDSDAKNYLSDNLFERLDLSFGKRSGHYNTRIESDKSGMITELKEKYFFDSFDDTPLVACNLLEIDSNDYLRVYRYKNKKGIIKIKDYLINLPIYFEESIEGVLEAILNGEISEAKAHIYVSFIYEFVVVNNNSLYFYIEKFNEELKLTIEKFNSFPLVKNDEVSMEQLEETEKYL